MKERIPLAMYVIASGRLSYDPLTGHLSWKGTYGRRAKAGRRAGHIVRNGYVLVDVAGKKYKAHRIAYFIATGELPEAIDHINGIKSDNRLANLRGCTHAENSYNRKSTATNSSGFRGVSFDRHCGKWRVRIRIDGKMVYGKRFDTIEMAVAARLDAERQYFGWFAPNGGM